MLSNYPNFKKRRQQDYVKDDRDGLTTFASLAAFTLLVFCLFFSPFFVLFLPLSALAFALLARKPNHFGLGLCVLITLAFSRYFSTGFIPEVVMIVRIAIILLWGLVFLKNIHEPSEYKMPSVLLGLFLLIAVIGSYYNSIYLKISELKLLFAGLFFFGLFKSAKSTDGFPGALFGIISAIVLLSLATFFFYPAVGYAFLFDPTVAPDMVGKFSGILNHPQLLAILLAVNLPLLLHVYLTRTGAIYFLAVIVLVATSVLIAISSSRTGFVATAVALISTLYMCRHTQDPVVRRRANSMWAFLVLALVVGLATSFEQIQIFLFKTNDLEAGISLSGRDEIIGASWNGFLAKPIWGNGFQVPSEFTEHGGAAFGAESDGTTIEKCFFITMLLEEVGLVGTLVFLGLVALLLRHWHRKGAYLAVAAMLAFLAANIGEACILSPSSIGGLSWVSIFAVHNLIQVPAGRPPRYDLARRGLY
jgi:hypothetical protein